MCNKWRLEGGLLVCDCCHCHCHWGQVLPLDVVVGAGNSLVLTLSDGHCGEMPVAVGHCQTMVGVCCHVVIVVVVVVVVVALHPSQ